MTVTEACARLIADLAAEGIPDPLAQRLTLGAVLADLAAIAGEPPAADTGEDLSAYTEATDERV